MQEVEYVADDPDCLKPQKRKMVDQMSSHTMDNDNVDALSAVK